MLRPARRLPKRFRRPVSIETKRFLKRARRKGRSRHIKDIYFRMKRRGERITKSWFRSFFWWIAVVSFLLLSTAFGLLVFSPIVRVREIKITRTDARLDIEDVQKQLSSFFGRHLLFLSGHEVEESVKSIITDLESVKVSKNYPSVLAVKIELDPLAARLNIIDPDEAVGALGTGTTVDFLTKKGIYVIAPLSRGDALPLISIVDWGVRPAAGTLLIDPSFLSRINDTQKALNEQFGHEITGVTMFLRAREYHLFLKDKKISLWFDISKSLEEQLLKYRTFLRNVNLQDVKEYVDLRISDRVIYK